jgi:hypothetical protein
VSLIKLFSCAVDWFNDNNDDGGGVCRASFAAGFDGCSTDPLGGQMGLVPEDFTLCTNLVGYFCVCSEGGFLIVVSGGVVDW